MLAGASLRQVLVAPLISTLQHAEAICRPIIQHPRQGDWVFRAFFFLHTIPLAFFDSSRSVSPSFWIIPPRIVSYRVGRNLTIRWYTSLIRSHSLLFHCHIRYGRYTWSLGPLSRALVCRFIHLAPHGTRQIQCWNLALYALQSTEIFRMNLILSYPIMSLVRLLVYISSMWLEYTAMLHL
jgi:hypothetical protein